MSHPADEPVDPDPLLEFANEPRPVLPNDSDTTQHAADVDVRPDAVDAARHAEMIAASEARIEQLEQSCARSSSELGALHAQVATLVAEIEDIKKRATRRSTDARLPRTAQPIRPSRIAPSIAGVIAGLAIGLFGWMSWQGDSRPSVDAEPAAVTIDAPIETEATQPVPAPAIALASATPVVQARRIADRPAERDEFSGLEPAYVGTLSIDAAPGGEVFIDRKSAGHTPLRVTNLKAGSHLVWIERDGYRRFTRVVQVPADRVSRLWADLEPIAAR